MSDGLIQNYQLISSHCLVVSQALGVGRVEYYNSLRRADCEGTACPVNGRALASLLDLVREVGNLFARESRGGVIDSSADCNCPRLLGDKRGAVWRLSAFLFGTTLGTGPTRTYRTYQKLRHFPAGSCLLAP